MPPDSVQARGTADGADLRVERWERNGQGVRLGNDVLPGGRQLRDPCLEDRDGLRRRRGLAKAREPERIVPRLADGPVRVYFGPAGARSPANRSPVSRPHRPR